MARHREKGRGEAIAQVEEKLAAVEDGARRLEASHPPPEVLRLGKAWKERFDAWRAKVGEAVALLKDRNQRVASGATPKPRSPARNSPESFTRTRCMP